MRNLNNLSGYSTYELIALKRPKGHYDLKHARAKLDKIYSLSRQTEKTLIRQFPNIATYSCSFPVALKICNRICNHLLVRNLKAVERDDKLEASAIYSSGRIIVRAESVWLVTLLHELAHHVVSWERIGSDHGKGFCEMMTLLWETADSIYKFPKNH